MRRSPRLRGGPRATGSTLGRVLAQATQCQRRSAGRAPWGRGETAVLVELPSSRACSDGRRDRVSRQAGRNLLSSIALLADAIAPVLHVPLQPQRSDVAGEGRRGARAHASMSRHQPLVSASHTPSCVARSAGGSSRLRGPRADRRDRRRRDRSSPGRSLAGSDVMAVRIRTHPRPRAVPPTSRALRSTPPWHLTA